MQIINHIEFRDGVPVIRGHGALKAKMVARMYLWDKQSIENIMAHYSLSAAEVHSAIAFYLDNQAEFDSDYDQTVAEHADEALTLEKFKAQIVDKQENE